MRGDIFTCSQNELPDIFESLDRIFFRGHAVKEFSMQNTVSTSTNDGKRCVVVRRSHHGLSAKIGQGVQNTPITHAIVESCSTFNVFLSVAQHQSRVQHQRKTVAVART